MKIRSTCVIVSSDGTLTLNYEGLIAPMVVAIQALSSELTSIETTVSGFAQSITSAVGNFGQLNTQQLCVTAGANDPSPVCITKAQLAAILSADGTIQASESVSQTSPQNPSASSSESVSSPPGSAGSGAATGTPPQIDPRLLPQLVGP
jgi:hypothetical protein